MVSTQLSHNHRVPFYSLQLRFCLFATRHPSGASSINDSGPVWSSPRCRRVSTSPKSKPDKRKLYLVCPLCVRFASILAPGHVVDALGSRQPPVVQKHGHAPWVPGLGKICLEIKPSWAWCPFSINSPPREHTRCFPLSLIFCGSRSVVVVGVEEVALVD